MSLQDIPLGRRIPDTDHSVSVSLPEWETCWKYMEHDEDIWKHVTAGYPRFFVNPILQKLMDSMKVKHGHEGENCYIYPTLAIANDCKSFILSHYKDTEPTVDNPQIRIVKDGDVYCVFHPIEIEVTGTQYWAKAGQAISSRQAEHFPNYPAVGDHKEVLCERIAEMYGHSTVKEDVYLYPTGMAVVYNTYKAIQRINKGKPVCFGFPFVDTLKILRDFRENADNAIFLGLGDAGSLDKLEVDLRNGLEISCLYCEFPSNPLLKSPDLGKIKKLSDEFGFIVVVDDTIGNPYNIDVLEYSDMVITSLTKLFSGAGDVMGGSLVLNRNSGKYDKLKKEIDEFYEDVLFSEDARVLEFNSRDFKERNDVVNKNTEVVIDLLKRYDVIAHIYHPSIGEYVDNYNIFKNEDGGYGGLFSIVFKEKQKAIEFYNKIKFAKGPSLGTNFTLMCPFVMLAHFNELEEVQKRWGVNADLIRISIGTEDVEVLVKEFSCVLEEL